MSRAESWSWGRTSRQGGSERRSTIPCVRIATGHWAQGIERKLLKAVQAALVSDFRIPENDRDVILDLYDET